MSAEHDYEAASDRLIKARATYRAAETELIKAERNMQEATQARGTYRLSNEHIAKLGVPLPRS